MRHNEVLAAHLAITAGFVNGGGFVLLGSFTSHVTGTVGRLGQDVARGDFGAAILAALLVAAFCFGSFAATFIVETRFRSVGRAYGVALAVEAALLACFVAVAHADVSAHPRVLDAEAMILALAMGMQNSLVTRLSGAVVRTTHLTGVVTDLGMELARWYRWERTRLVRVPSIAPGRMPPERPDPAKALLLATITLGFVAGSVMGAVATIRTGSWAMAAPLASIAAASLQAFRTSDAPSPMAS